MGSRPIQRGKAKIRDFQADHSWYRWQILSGSVRLTTDQPCERLVLARKLAGILFAMTQHGRDYDPERLRRAMTEPSAVSEAPAVAA